MLIAVRACCGGAHDAGTGPGSGPFLSREGEGDRPDSGDGRGEARSSPPTSRSAVEEEEPGAAEGEGSGARPRGCEAASVRPLSRQAAKSSLSAVARGPEFEVSPHAYRKEVRHEAPRNPDRSHRRIPGRNYRLGDGRFESRRRPGEEVQSGFERVRGNTDTLDTGQRQASRRVCPTTASPWTGSSNIRTPSRPSSRPTSIWVLRPSTAGSWSSCARTWMIPLRRRGRNRARRRAERSRARSLRRT